MLPVLIKSFLKIIYIMIPIQTFVFLDQVSGPSAVASVSSVNFKVERSSPVRPSPVLVCLFVFSTENCLYRFIYISFGLVLCPSPYMPFVLFATAVICTDCYNGVYML